MSVLINTHYVKVRLSYKKMIIKNEGNSIFSQSSLPTAFSQGGGNIRGTAVG